MLNLLKFNVSRIYCFFISHANLNPFEFLIDHVNPFFHHFFFAFEAETAEVKPLHDK